MATTATGAISDTDIYKTAIGFKLKKSLGGACDFSGIDRTKFYKWKKANPEDWELMLDRVTVDMYNNSSNVEETLRDITETIESLMKSSLNVVTVHIKRCDQQLQAYGEAILDTKDLQLAGSIFDKAFSAYSLIKGIGKDADQIGAFKDFAAKVAKNVANEINGKEASPEYLTSMTTYEIIEYDTTAKATDGSNRETYNDTASGEGTLGDAPGESGSSISNSGLEESDVGIDRI